MCGRIPPLSKDDLNSVRMMTGELRIMTGSEPRKFIEVAEYKSFPGKNTAAGKLKAKDFLSIHFPF